MNINNNAKNNTLLTIPKCLFPSLLSRLDPKSLLNLRATNKTAKDRVDNYLKDHSGLQIRLNQNKILEASSQFKMPISYFSKAILDVSFFNDIELNEDDYRLDVLKQFTSLKEINFYGYNTLKEKEVVHILKVHSNWEVINLAITNIEGSSFKDLNLPNLKKIRLNYCHQLTNLGLTYILKACSNLEKINLDNTKIDGSAFKGLNLPNLKEIKLEFCKNLTDTELKYILEACPNLEKINLGYTKINGSCFKDLIFEKINSHVKKLKSGDTKKEFCLKDLAFEKIKDINLEGCKNLKDPALNYILKTCPNLKKINLGHTTINGSCFKDEKLNHVEEINLKCCSKLNEKIPEHIVNACPNLKTVGCDLDYKFIFMEAKDDLEFISGI